MKLRYIEAWCVDLEIDEDTLRREGLEGKTPEEVCEALNSGDYPDCHLSPDLFSFKSLGASPENGGKIHGWPSDGYELYSTEWEARQ